MPTTRLAATLRSVSASLSSTPVFEDALAETARCIGEALDVWSVDVWTYAEDHNTIVHEAVWSRAGAGQRDAERVGMAVALDDRPDIKRLIDARAPVEWHVDDPDMPEQTRAALERVGYKSTVRAPLIVGDDVVGVMGVVETRAVRRFDDADRELFSEVCRLVGIGIRNAHLSRRDEQQRDRLASLHETVHSFATHLDADVALQTLYDVVARALATPDGRVTISVRTEKGAYEQRIPPLDEETDGDSDADDGDALDSGDSDPACATSACDELIERALEKARAFQAREKGSRARLVAPMLLQGSPAGYIEVDVPQARRFTHGEVEFVQTLANQTAVALDYCRLSRVVERQSAVDGVTGLYNRWYYYERLYSETTRARRYSEPLSLLMVDVDGFSRFVSTRGDGDGNAVLRHVGRLISASLRKRVDVACRIGASRFAILLPNTPPYNPGAALVAERLRSSVQGTELRDEDHGLLGRFSLAIGVAGFPGHAEDADDLADASERALQAVIDKGGDGLKVFDPRS